MTSRINAETMGQVQNLLQQMVAHPLIKKPEDPVPYIIQFLEDKKGTGAQSLSMDEKIQLDKLREELSVQEEKRRTIKMKEIKAGTAVASESDQDMENAEKSSSDSGQDEYLDEVNDPYNPVTQ